MVALRPTAALCAAFEKLMKQPPRSQLFVKRPGLRISCSQIQMGFRESEDQGKAGTRKALKVRNSRRTLCLSGGLLHCGTAFQSECQMPANTNGMVGTSCTDGVQETAVHACIASAWQGARSTKQCEAGL